MRSRVQLAIAAVLVAAVLAPSAAGSPAADLAAMARDYSRDEKVTPCRFTQGQLEAARREISEDIETYAKGIRSAIMREIKRWKDRGCAGKSGRAALRIVAVQAQGEAGAESVTIKNVGSKTVDLRDYALRDAADHTLKFRPTKLKAGRKLRVITGCASGRTSAVRRGSRYYACREQQVWDDGGDTVELLGPGGGLLSQKTY